MHYAFNGILLARQRNRTNAACPCRAEFAVRMRWGKFSPIMLHRTHNAHVMGSCRPCMRWGIATRACLAHAMWKCCLCMPCVCDGAVLPIHVRRVLWGTATHACPTRTMGNCHACMPCACDEEVLPMPPCACDGETMPMPSCTCARLSAACACRAIVCRTVS